jgi:hypothetical protein
MVNEACPVATPFRSFSPGSGCRGCQDIEFAVVITVPLCFNAVLSLLGVAPDAALIHLYRLGTAKFQKEERIFESTPLLQPTTLAGREATLSVYKRSADRKKPLKGNTRAPECAGR